MVKGKNSKRDLILIIILVLVMGSILLIYQLNMSRRVSSKAHVFYSARSTTEPIVTVDFVDQKVTKNYDQDATYPIIDLTQRTITLLGEYKVDGIKQEVVIQFDFERTKSKQHL